MTKEEYIEIIEPLLLESLSLNLDEKEEVRKAYERLTSFQFEELIRIFRAEKEKFEEFSKSIPDEIAKLRAKRKTEGYVSGWVDVEKVMENIREREEYESLKYGINDFAFLSLSFKTYSDFELTPLEIARLNLSIDKLSRELFDNNSIRILQVQHGSINEILTGNIGQVITIGAFLFGVGKGVLHLLKEGVLVKHVFLDAKKKDIEIDNLLSDKEKENRKVDNVKKFLIKYPEKYTELEQFFDSKLAQLLLENFDFDIMDFIKKENIEKALKTAELIQTEFPLEEVDLLIKKNPVPNKGYDVHGG